MVIAIIAVLIALLLPAVQQAREAAGGRSVKTIWNNLAWQRTIIMTFNGSTGFRLCPSALAGYDYMTGGATPAIKNQSTPAEW